MPTGSDWLDEINLEVTWPGDGSPDIREDNSDCHLLIYPATTRPTAMPAKKPPIEAAFSFEHFVLKGDAVQGVLHIFWAFPNSLWHKLY